jgi:DNA polymerase I-like protein with 3'-5' exonuclease and polymerase domains
MKEWWFVAKKGKGKEPDYRRVPGDILCKYGGLDTIVEWLVMDTLSDQIDPDLLVPHNEILIPAAYSLASVEAWGWQVDVKNAVNVVMEHGLKIDESLVALRKFKHFKQFEKDYGGFNVDSFPQKSRLFYGYDTKTRLKFPDRKDRYVDMKIDPTYMTKSGHPSTDKEWRLAHITKVPILVPYNQYVKLHTILKDFFNVLPGYLANIDCRIHTNYNASKVRSGRLSSSDPNTQNWPDEKYFWKLFISRFKNGSFIKCDYSQFELRWLCHLANDLPMIQTFKDGKDIHNATARDFMKITDEMWDEMTDRQRHERRQWGKRFNFAVANDRGAYHLSLDLTALQQELYPDKVVVITKEQAQEYINDWYKPHTAIKEWKKEQIIFCEQNGYVVSPYNYRRHAPDIKHYDIAKKNAARRAIISFLMQSSAGVMMLKAKNAIFENLVKNEARTVICGSCYDSVYLDAPEDEAEEVCVMVKRTMLELTEEIEFKVPLQVDLEMGPNGGELEPYGA